MTTVNVIPFNSTASAIGNQFKAFDDASTKLMAFIGQTMQAYIDQWALVNDKDKASCNAMGKEIRECEAVQDLIALGAMEKKTFTEYAQSAMRALHWGVPFNAALKNDPAYALPWGKAKPKDTTKAGKVTSTSREDLDKTLSKAIAQARMLGLTELAADILDVCLESLDGFKEVEV